MWTWLEQYRMDPTTWLYVASLMTIGIYFRFSRFFSIRNLDLIGIISFAPGLLLITHGLERMGYLWFFVVSGLFLIRLLIDPAFRRRPLMEPNLSSEGMTFMAFALMFFLIANIVTNRVLETRTSLTKAASTESPIWRVPVHRGPGYLPFYRAITFEALPSEPAVRPESQPTPEESAEEERSKLILGVGIKIVAIVAQCAIVLAMILFGLRHFDNLQTGLAAASLYLLLPYTSQLTARLDHVVPGALVIWALAMYRRPMISGMLLGGAAIVYYPFFLLPLWIGFYVRRGLLRFLGGFFLVVGVLVILLFFISPSWRDFGNDLAAMFGKHLLRTEGADGFWQYHWPYFRIPIFAGFAVVCVSLGLWPSEKNLANLLSGTAAVLLAAQFCLIHQGGLYMAWYAPALILTVFRPTLEARTAVRAVPRYWFGALPRLTG
ncbi:MAG: hypothetical protein ACUVQG_14150 [Thermogutta sp.]